MNLMRVKNNLIAVISSAENAMNEVEELIEASKKPNVVGPTEFAAHPAPEREEEEVEVKVEVCEHPTNQRTPVTTMGGGPDKFYCKVCEQTVEI